MSFCKTDPRSSFNLCYLSGGVGGAQGEVVASLEEGEGIETGGEDADVNWQKLAPFILTSIPVVLVVIQFKIYMVILVSCLLQNKLQKHLHVCVWL